MHTCYSGQLVRLRPFRDFEEVAQVLYPLELIDFGHWAPHPWSLPSLRARFDENALLPAAGAGFWAMERLENGACVGYSYIVLPRIGEISAEIGTMILPEGHGLRLGVESKALSMCVLFENYPVQRVYANTLGSNRAALRSMELSGLRYSFHEQRFYARSGDTRDCVTYDISREQWEQHPIRDSIKRGYDYEL